MPASQKVATSPPALASTAQQMSSQSAAAVSQAQPTQSPVPTPTAQQPDHPMPQAASPQPQSQPVVTAPVLAAHTPNVSAAAAVSLAAVPLQQTEAAPPVAVSQPGSSAASDAQLISSTEAPEQGSRAAPEAQLVSGTDAPSSLATPDARGTLEPQAQQLISTPPEAHSAPGPAVKQEAIAASKHADPLSKEEGTTKAVDPAEEHALSNGNVHAKAHSSNEVTNHIDSSPLDKQADDSKAAAQQDAGTMNSLSEVPASAAQPQNLKQQNGPAQSESTHIVSSTGASPASAAPGQAPAGQLSVPAAQAGQAGQPGQAPATYPPGPGSARPEQLPMSAPTVQRPGSLTKASPLPSLASAVTQQWLGSSPAGAVRPAPQPGEPIPTISLQTCALQPSAPSRLKMHDHAGEGPWADISSFITAHFLLLRGMSSYTFWSYWLELVEISFEKKWNNSNDKDSHGSSQVIFRGRAGPP